MYIDTEGTFHITENTMLENGSINILGYEARLNEIATKELEKHQLPTSFSYRTAFILGYKKGQTDLSEK